MKAIELRGVVEKVTNPGISHCTFIFNNCETGKLIIGVDRTHKLFYEVHSGMVLKLSVSLKGLIGRGNYIQNSLNVVCYEILDVEGGD